MKTVFTSIVIRLLCLGVLIPVSPVWANTILVFNPNDSGPGTLRSALGSAGSGDTIQFALQWPNTIELESPLFVSGKTLTINGPGPSLLTISGDFNVPVFVNHGDVTISGVRMWGGSGLLGGCVFNGAGTLTLIDSVVHQCEGRLGGGILNIGTLNLVNSMISSNLVGIGVNPGVGGGILNFGGTLRLTGSIVEHNFSLPGDRCQYQLDFTMGCGGGGGIYNTAGGVVTVVNSKVVSNQAMDGGGILNHNGTVTITNSTVADNEVFASGAGIENTGTLSVVGSTISGNHAYGQDFPYTVLDQVVSVPGGECDPTDPTDPDCVIIYLASPVFTNGGGGLRNRGGAVLKNTTIAGNSARNESGLQLGGGGILVNGQVYLSNVTLSGNSAVCNFYGSNLCDGAGIYTSFAHVEIKNSIFANQPDGGNCSINGGEGLVSGNHNLSDDATCNFTGGADLNNTPAGFDPAGLADNGGPTRTVALLPESLAVDAIPAAGCTDFDGGSLANDQRGALRPQGAGCDMGAYEYFDSVFPLVALRTYTLVGTVNSLPLAQGTRTSLTSKLQAAADLLNKGNVNAAGGQLRAFINRTEALVRSGSVSSAQGSMLIAEAEAIIEVMGG